jgi:exosome complex exonuclease RRP6
MSKTPTSSVKLADSVEKWCDAVVVSLVSCTTKSQFITNDHALIKSIPLLANKLVSATSTFESLSQKVFLQQAKASTQAPDFIDNYTPIVQDTVDYILEKADVCLDQYSKHKNAPSTISTPKLKDAEVEQPACGRPQSRFTEPIDNSSKPFLSKLKVKHNAKVPFKNEVGKHPYEYELHNYVLPRKLLVSKAEVMFENIETTPCTWITKPAKLKELCQKLLSCTEIAVDLEHHDYRTFQGFTCLIQISTRDENYLIDALELRHELHILNEVFSNPNIIKVLHG